MLDCLSILRSTSGSEKAVVTEQAADRVQRQFIFGVFW
jgi:hypothetical protein